MRPEQADREAQGTFSHVPGCKCETHDAPFLNVRDQTCIEWTAIMQRWLAEVKRAEREAGAREALLNAADQCDRDAEDGHCASATCAANNRITARWLRDRAAALGTGEEGQG